jgi:predicted dehydrogenase
MASIAYFGYEVVRLNDESNWKGTKDKAGGGVVLDAGYHVIYLTNRIMGRPRAVSSGLVKAVVKAPNKAEDNALLLVEYEGGALAEIIASFTTVYPTSFQAPTLHMSYGFFGDKGTLWGNYRSFGEAGWQLDLYTNDGCRSLAPEASKGVNMLGHFVDCLANGKPCEVTAEDILDAQAVADAAYLSHEQGRKIQIQAQRGKRILK